MTTVIAVLQVIIELYEGIWDFLAKNALLFFIENSGGKYISPFHDIPIYANEAEVILTTSCVTVNAADFCDFF